jgi:hypothetical protein
MGCEKLHKKYQDGTPAAQVKTQNGYTELTINKSMKTISKPSAKQ